MKRNWNQLNYFQKIFLYSKNYLKYTPFYINKLFSKYIEYNNKKIKIKFCNIGVKSYFRVKTLLTKEPLTINWINNFKKGSIFWDVGSNIGIYSIYAAKKSKVKVYSFEPMPLNYKNLCINISLNKLAEFIIPFCWVLNDKNSTSNLYIKWFEEGFSGTSFNKNIEISKKNGLIVKQFSISIDTLIYKLHLPCPNYLKIDVDGNDLLILKGAKKTIQNSKLKSIMVEIPKIDMNKSTKKKKLTNEIMNYLKRNNFYCVNNEKNNYFFEKKQR